MNTQIHVWSDYVCPFCLIAEELIDRAIGDRGDVEVVHHPHELRPYPAPTLRPEDAYLPEIWQRAVYPMAERFGVSMQLPTVSRQPYTELAFRGAQYAAEQDRAAAYHRRMLRAFFREDLDIGDRAVLSRLAEEVGLDPVAYDQALSDEGYAERHRRALAEAAEADITVVPTILIGSRRFEGVAAEGAIRRALDEAAA
ncbi:DsbA family protein [Nocardioides rotundus]|uniref:DsbA family oxidoreductase n=1 Tax=Nocardioides rotundus TaxID=1774216 RepID=UPI001CBB4638|nr:DsbA family protein [Nocardioides rotundus]UAL31256.1 DsbA family protein [Nocardioides rotundus]